MNKDKIIREFMRLPQEIQIEVIRTHDKRARIVHRISSINKELELLNLEVSEIRSTCEHPLVDCKATMDEDEYGKMLRSGQKYYVCPDCGKTWVEPFLNA